VEHPGFCFPAKGLYSAETRKLALLRDTKMEFTCAKIDGTEILNAKLTGQFNLDEAQNSFVELLESVKREKTDKVLVDGTAMTGEPEMFERFLYGAFAAIAVSEFNQDPSVRIKFAYALKPPLLDAERFGESMAVKRGMDVKAFESIQEARAWLAG
jgi:hypothetical protein